MKKMLSFTRKRVIPVILSAAMVFSTGLPAPAKAAAVPSGAEVLSESEDVYKTIGHSAKAGAAGTEGSVPTYTFDLTTGEQVRISFLTEEIVRINMEPEGKFVENPVPNNEADKAAILETPVREFAGASVNAADDGTFYVYETSAVRLSIRKADFTMKMERKEGGGTWQKLWEESKPLRYNDIETIQTLKTDANEYFYGGGTQNGYFSHKGKTIKIVNESGWENGSVSSPSPFYLSSLGYSVLRHTWKPGYYDFGKTAANEVLTEHQEKRFDAFYFAGTDMPSALDLYTDVTGKPILMPEWAFYLGHLNAYNRDWVTEDAGVTVPVGTPGARRETLLRDGVYRLNQYIDNDMPLGWFLPNDGYGAGYGQTDTLDGNIENLRKFTEQVNAAGTQVGLWTQQNLYPKDPANPKPDDRNIDLEVGTAGVRGVKTDVAWVYPGYSFALNGVRQAAESIENNSPDRRFVVSLDGWAGTQRYAGLWSGDQSGGNWEYIRLHIPTYLGSGLSGNPNIGSDADGIFGGKNGAVNARDYQWKAFTPIIMDMDGWGSTPKNPFAHGEPYTSVNRMYLKLKAQMMPYTYSLAKEAHDTAMPMMRPMVLEYPDDPVARGTRTQYQYMYGPNFLVAPIYNKADNDAQARSNIYLPDENQVWIDYFTGKQYQGGQMLSRLEAPLWKLPLLVKNGAIVPMAVENDTALPSNNEKVKALDGSEPRIFEVWPSGDTGFDLYEDDGASQQYKKAGAYATTHVKASAPRTATGTAIITVDPAVPGGSSTYAAATGNAQSRGTEFTVNLRAKPGKITVKTGSPSSMATDTAITASPTKEAFDQATGSAYYYEEAPRVDILKYATAGGETSKIDAVTTPKLYIKVKAVNVETEAVEVILEDFNNTQPAGDGSAAPAAAPAGLNGEATFNSVRLSWGKAEGSDISYDLEITGLHGEEDYTVRGIKENSYLHENLPMDTPFAYRVRAVNAKTGAASPWSAVYNAGTALDPYRNAIKIVGIGRDLKDAEGNEVGDHENDEIGNAIDGESDKDVMWHTDWDHTIVFPGSVVFDMGQEYQLEQFEYVPRANGGNGTITEGKISISLDEKHWKDVEDFTWKQDASSKLFPLNGARARYLKITVNKAAGNLISAREFRPYKVDATDGRPVGDTLASVGELDMNDYNEHKLRYAGIDKESSLWGQVKNCDLNYNDVLDSYDVAYVATKVKESMLPSEETVNGQITLQYPEKALEKGEAFDVKVMGTKLNDLYAFNLAIPFASADIEAGEDKDIFSAAAATEGMDNLSKKLPPGVDAARLSVFFSSLGKPVGEGVGITDQGTVELATLHLKASRAMTAAELQEALKPSYGLLVGTDLTDKDALTAPDENTEPEPTVPYVPKRVRLSASKVWDDALNDFKDLPINGESNLTDKNDASFWETSYSGGYGGKFPVYLTLDLGKAYTLDHFEYVPRGSANGSIREIDFSYSADGSTWVKANKDRIIWWPDSQEIGVGVQSFAFPEKASARYVRLEIYKAGRDEAANQNVAGLELKPFVKPETAINPTPTPTQKPSGGSGSGSGGSDAAPAPTPTRNPDAPAVVETPGDWNDIVKDIASAKQGSTIVVTVSKDTGVSAEVFKSLKGKDVNLELQVDDLFVWNINGKNITGLTDQQKEINLGISKTSKKKLATAISRQLAGGRNEVIQFEIAYDGQLPFKGELKFLAGKEKSGQPMYLSYYNEAKKFMDYKGTSKVDKEGYVAFTMDHASQYVLSTVKPAPVGVATAVTVYRGKTYTMKPANLPKGGKVTYKSANKSLAKVSKTGRVSALKSGKTKIQTTVTLNGTKYTYQTAMTIKAPSITLTEKTSKLKAGQSFDFYAKLNGFDGKITWTSSDKSVAVVKDGKVKAVKPGTVTITASSGKIAASQKIQIVK